ncbi:182 kDa tankyrase-1-binding protein isoform X2 [Neopelma chrysocephalum]|uniref:182 kDa tankyrase-1-binding protein isoform X2 n=1 Tax=Neopelma chrysocephalum TaxID=114329 RepID=UPI000FCD1FE1|nr:182 kDa tankyrase-1-binding protein isoform X2 [Neopelma chrysocephalum]
MGTALGRGRGLLGDSSGGFVAVATGIGRAGGGPRGGRTCIPGPRRHPGLGNGPDRFQIPGESRERRWRQRETRGDGNPPSPPALRPPTCVPARPGHEADVGKGLTSHRAPRVTMASQPQPLRPTVPCAAPASTGGAGLAGSPDKGTTRPKPPVRPKPRVLPKPAVPAKPTVPPPVPGPRHPRPELPSAEKMNRLAGPQPYSGGGTGGPLRRPSFTVRSPETPNGKGLPSPPVAAAEEEVPPAPPTPSRKGPAPFKVTPVPVAARPERFPGTTVEEILAKMDSREGPGSPDRAWLSPFCPDPSSRFGSKTFAAFRRRPSGEADGDPPGEAPHTPRPAAGELGMGDDGHSVAETSGSPPAGPHCAGDPRGHRRPPSPPDLSSLQLGALGPPGSPRPPTSPTPAPGAPFQPPEPSAPAPGSPDAPAELLAPDSPTLPPGSPESPTQPPAEVPAPSIQAPGAPSATKPHLGTSRSPGSPHTPGEGSPDTASPPGTPELPPRVTCPPGSPEAATEYLGRPSPPLAKASRPPGSPEGPDDSAVSPQSCEGPDFSSPPRDVGLRRSSEGVLQSSPTGQGLGELGGSLSALPRPGDPLSEPSLGSESGWSLSQSFEWTFPSRGTRLSAFPPRSPIRETPDSGLSEEGESDGEAAAHSPPEDSRSEGPDSRGAEGAPCPGGPVAQQEAEGLTEEEEEEGEVERGTPGSQSPLHVMEPGWHPAEPEPPTQPSITTAAPLDPSPSDPAPPDPAPLADLAWAGDSPKDLQGPGGPGQAEGPPQGPDPHADPGWLTELLASPGAHTTGHGSPEGLLGWSRKDLCSEFGIGRPRQAGTFDWSCPAVSRERDWPAETEQDQEFRAKSGWDSSRSDRAGARPDGHFSAAREGWSSDYRGTELMGDTKLGGSDWSQSLGAGESCLRDPDFGSSTAKWGQGYGLGRASSTEELNSGQPTWAGRYGTGDTEMKDRELTPDWASKYSSRDARSKDEDFTLGWAGRSSTGDTGSPDKELGPSRPSWNSRYSTRDMESQDWEFSPSRPAWTGEYKDTQSQDREFSPSRLAEGSECSTGNVETQDREFSPSGAAWDNRYSTQDMESQDREFSPSRPAWTGEIRDMESQDREFSPRRPAWAGEYREMESQDQEFNPSRLTWDDRSSSRDTESQDREFSPSRLAEASECTTRDLETQDGEFSPTGSAWGDRSSTSNMETQDSGFTPSRATWDDGHSTGNMETRHGELFSPSGAAWGERSSTRDVEAQDREFSPSGAARDGEHGSVLPMEEEQELIPGRLSWSGEGSVGQARLVGGREEDVPGSLCPDPLAQESTWGSAHQQERGSSSSRDWAEELGGGDCHNQFGAIGTERVPDPCSSGALDGAMSRGLQSLAGWHRDISLDTDDARWSQDLEHWSMELQDAEAKRQEWASAFGARCAARSRDLATGERSLGGDTGTEDSRSLRLSAPSPPMGDAPADPPALETPRGELLSPTEEERDVPKHAAALQSPAASSLLPEAASGIPVDTGIEEPTLDHPDGESPSGWGEQRLSLGTAQPEGPMEQGQEFPFLEDTELLDSSVFRSKASLGRKRRHRAPALRPTAPEGDSWIFRDSTEPRPAPAASSDEEAAEEPRSRRAKLRGRNRSAEEGTSSGDSKGTSSKDPHVQRSKSCKIPGVSGKPPALPPKPEKSSGSEASPPHWLQALKLKRKKP